LPALPQSFFKQKGRVEHIELLRDRNGKSTGKCFVTYTHESDAMDAIRDYNAQVAKGRPISITVVS
jgi:RNA recognition motif-containing protein